MVPLIGGPCARACSPSGIRFELVLDEWLPAKGGGTKDKVMAGETPANPATLAPKSYRIHTTGLYIA